MRVDVELRHAGQAAHSEHAVLPQQQASCAAENRPITAPMLTNQGLDSTKHREGDEGLSSSLLR